MGVGLVLVDLQERIVGQEWEPRPGPDAAAVCLRLAAVAREAGAPVVAVQTWRLDPAGDRVPVEGDELIEGLAALATDVVTKHSWGAFGGTQLDAVLRRRRVDHVVLAGIATNFGVESTARAADDLGYALTLVEAGMTTRTAHAHAFSVETIFPALGTVAGEDDATQVLRGDPH